MSDAAFAEFLAYGLGAGLVLGGIARVLAALR
jgi:hypothetical protein